MKYTITQSRLLYVLSMNDRKHKDLLKVGEVFVDNDVADNSSMQELAKAVRPILDKRSFMKGVIYHLEYVECTTYAQFTKCYKADDVYRTLHKMGIPSKALDKIGGEDADIWFACTLFDIQEAIRKIKDGKGAGYGAIKFRPEQEKAISDTVSYFTKEFKTSDKGKTFLWNAKMRFGKTLSGLEVAKRCGYRSTLIITHRPVVDKGWHDDFKKIFGDMPEYTYATRMSDEDSTGGDFYSLRRKVDAGTKKLVFFVSMQYLRLSQFVGGKEKHFDPLKRAIMEYDWDFVMVDEAHEGIEAAAGVRVMDKLKKENTRILSLSGTPFNLLDKYEEGEIYTWDYVMEQLEKQKWDDKHFGDPNPYADLPRMQILTFTLPKMVRDEAIENNEVFKFHEFFRVWTEDDKRVLQKKIDRETSALKKVDLQAQLAEIQEGNFVHEGAVRRFLDKLVEESPTSQYPFSNDEFREHFRHTFWLLPGVKEAAALYELLKEHEVFGVDNEMFHIVNVAGDGNIEDKDGSALKEVQDAIKKYEYTITLSCGKLTTGVSVPEWTAVLCMKGSENTPAANYMQTIFRVQTHAVLEGRQKSDCYVFDFAPDRALTAVAETAKMAVYAQGDKGKKMLKLTQKEEEEHLEAFIKLCPVLSMDEGEMGKHFSANQIFEKLSNVYIERAVRSGYADNSIYNPDQLLNLTPEQEKALGDVHDLLGSMPAGWKPEKININNQGLGNTENAEQIKYIYYLTNNNTAPARPSTSSQTDKNGCPTTDDKDWSDVMNAVSPLFKYLFVSHSRLVDGKWTAFSQPVLWKEYKEIPENERRAKEQRDKENKEKRARMSVLRGVAIRIPLLVYGAEINDDAGEEITIDNFASEEIVDQASWDEFMPNGFTKETFNILKDCFDRSIFTGAAKRIRAMVKEADNLNTEDRINKIATIFSYFHNPDKETVLTPWKVVNRHMSDCLGGWCFYNEEFDAEYTEENEFGENIKMPRFVDRGDVTKDIFGDYNARILEINSKTGLYPLYMAYSMFKGIKEPEFRKLLTGERGKCRDAAGYEKQAKDDLEIWKDVLQDNIFVVCRTPMAVSITKRTLAGFRNDIRMNVKCYEQNVEVNDLISAGVIKLNSEELVKEGKNYIFNGQASLKCDMISVLRTKPELFQKDIVKGISFWHVYNSIPQNENEDINNMKFKAIVGNPPYQIMDGGAKASASPIYQLFVDSSKKLSPSSISMIMPSKWFAGGKGLDEFRESMRTDKHIEYIKDFVNSKELFPTASIGGGICYFLWNNKHNGKCHFTNILAGRESTMERSLDEYEVIVRYNEAINILNTAVPDGTPTISDIMLSRNPFGQSSNVRGKDIFYPNSIELVTSQGSYFVDKDSITENVDYVNSWKVSISKVTCEHAGEPDKNGQVKVLSSLRTFGPNVACTDSYLIIGKFETEREANNLRSYLSTKFARFLLLLSVSSINLSKDKFKFVPMQDFSKPWTDEELYLKYNLNEDEINYIDSIIKPLD